MARVFIDTNFSGVIAPEELPGLLSVAFNALEDDLNAGPDIISLSDPVQKLPEGIRRGDLVIRLTNDELFIGMYNGIAVVYASIGTFTGAITDAQHGTRSGGTLHPTATTTVEGFMSAADKIKANHYKGDTSTAAPASTTEYPTDGDWGFHTDTAGATYKLAKNKGGVIFTVLLT